MFIALGAKGLINSFKYKHDTVFKVAFFGYMLVGSGSFAFHSTLKCRSGYNVVAGVMLICYRPHAACGRAFHDIHRISHVLRYILILAVSESEAVAGFWLDLSGCVHYREGSCTGDLTF
jgi:hypothetical protein